MIHVTKLSVSGERTTKTVESRRGTLPCDNVDWDDACAFLQGWVEVINVRRGAWLMVDEEGRLKSLPVNHAATLIAGRTIVGNAIFIETLQTKSNFDSR